MITGRLRQDDACHWYLVPKPYIRTFDLLSAKIDKLYPGLDEDSDKWDKAIEEFENDFGEFRLPGGPFNFDVIIEK